ncbi:hypothetical protein B0H21DRAFT_465496 [Amylocystis lapponica]|nr:hypothetical protein B0H21DRAFT_465496 [Amylocystis lapponica]
MVKPSTTASAYSQTQSPVVSSTNASTSKSSSPNKSEIVEGVLGGIVGILVLLFLGLYVRRRGHVMWRAGIRRRVCGDKSPDLDTTSAQPFVVLPEVAETEQARRPKANFVPFQVSYATAHLSAVSDTLVQSPSQTNPEGMSRQPDLSIGPSDARFMESSLAKAAEGPATWRTPISNPPLRAINR